MFNENETLSMQLFSQNNYCKKKNRFLLFHCDDTKVMLPQQNEKLFLCDRQMSITITSDDSSPTVLWWKARKMSKKRKKKQQQRKIENNIEMCAYKIAIACIIHIERATEARVRKRESQIES